jgi:hypothetical protein
MLYVCGNRRNWTWLLNGLLLPLLCNCSSVTVCVWGLCGPRREAGRAAMRRPARSCRVRRGVGEGSEKPMHTGPAGALAPLPGKALTLGLGVVGRRLGRGVHAHEEAGGGEQWLTGDLRDSGLWAGELPWVGVRGPLPTGCARFYLIFNAQRHNGHLCAQFPRHGRSIAELARKGPACTRTLPVVHAPACRVPPGRPNRTHWLASTGRSRPPPSPPPL